MTMFLLITAFFAGCILMVGVCASLAVLLISLVIRFVRVMLGADP